MVILIADSGSTKSDWVAIDESGNEIKSFSTIGFNPYFHSADLVVEELTKSEAAISIAQIVNKVFFYGAGSSSKDLCSVIEGGLSKVFVNAEVIVGHDLDGAAYSTWSGEKAITCILGTGSNSCMFDGQKVYEEVPSLAYILGDEGSGSWFGKKLLQAYFYKQLPKEIHDDFYSEFGYSVNDVNRLVYKEPNPNVFLASFMKFISKHKNSELIQSWLLDGFGIFLDAHVKCFEGYQEMPVHFIGSVAFHFQDSLREACEIRKIKMGNTIRKPIDGLAKYHLECIL